MDSHSSGSGSRQSRRLALSLSLLLSWGAALPFAACRPASPQSPAPVKVRGGPTTPDGAIGLLTTLAHDSLEGRRTGMPGATKAAGVIAREMARLGLEPGGDSGYYQRVALAKTQGALRLLPSFAALDTIPADQRRPAFNVIGILRGADRTLGHEHIVVAAHYDHLGVGRPVKGDSIYNGADDDASGTVAVLEAARQLAAGPRPRRTVVFIAFTGEEAGALGSQWYSDHPVLPLDSMVAELEIEMIDRPDSLAGGPGRAWLTGYERSTMGATLAAAGIPVVADPRPNQDFFERSDNISFARRGIVAHTLSSFGLHSDYHAPSDEVSKADPVHFATVINAAARAVRLLADGERPAWKPGGRP